VTSAAAAPTDRTSTRERILDVALDFFVEQGYDKTSLRQIAESMGFSKAALYYHFASKEDILLALHLRLHKMGETAVLQFDEVPPTLSAWRGLLLSMVDEMLAQRQLIILHQRNHGALESIADRHPHGEHEDMLSAIQRTLGNSEVPARDRVRLSAALGVLLAGLTFAGDVLKDLPLTELGSQLRDVIDDICVPAG
jgi:AcrR family transcriptional regulator